MFQKPSSDIVSVCPSTLAPCATVIAAAQNCQLQCIQVQTAHPFPKIGQSVASSTPGHRVALFAVPATQTVATYTVGQHCLHATSIAPMPHTSYASCHFSPMSSTR
jgi:hypothetical protein